MTRDERRKRIGRVRGLDVYRVAFEAAETQTWLEFTLKCSSIVKNEAA